MALPRGMFRRGGTLYARKDVPLALREIIGQTSLQQTLGTADVNRARVVFHDVMRSFEARIASAREALANQSPPSITIDMVRDLGMTSAQVEAYQRAQAIRPENQIKTTVRHMERRLLEAGLVRVSPEAVSLDELFERWKREKKPRPGSELEFLRAKDAFKKLNGDLPIAEYTSAHARAWKDHVLELRGRDGKPLAHATLVKWFSSVKTLFRLADRNDLLIADPFAKVVVEKPRRAKKNDREEWEIEDLRKLFSSPVYVDGLRPRAGSGEAAYWLPVLALYHGCRIGELCQLDRADVVRKAGVWCLALRPSDEDEDEVAKSIKTEPRTIPLHQAVIDLGFLEYVRTVRSKKLFPLIRPDSIGRWGQLFGRWFSRYRTKIGLGGRWQREFHGLRHTWKTAARAAKLDEHVHDEISGHEPGSVGRTYGSIPISTLNAELDKIVFDVVIPKWRDGRARS